METRFSTETVPEKLLQGSDEKVLGVWLSRYTVETCNAKCERHPPSVCYQLLRELLRSVRAENPCCPNFLDKKNPHLKYIVVQPCGY